MRTLGMITTGVAAAMAVVAVAVGVRSLPDIRRYVRMRSM
ncbi:hypothetical protein GCM10011583_45480 [Streptomyces camponoticapitis]|uniref:Uncharacterized protein n=1 Tax=Streptomyces camponoticapitis TaxID=1616125 RepID=A0ABQ2EGM3_9ACTN|nr:hypothetical protein GCM10011583_45480 [Streptomyces camponoticapitis]